MTDQRMPVSTKPFPEWNLEQIVIDLINYSITCFNYSTKIVKKFLKIVGHALQMFLMNISTNFVYFHLMRQNKKKPYHLQKQKINRYKL